MGCVLPKKTNLFGNVIPHGSQVSPSVLELVLCICSCKPIRVANFIEHSVHSFAHDVFRFGGVTRGFNEFREIG